MINPLGLLYIEPTRQKASEPLEDVYTYIMSQAMNEAKAAGRTGGLLADGTFRPGISFRGFHVCKCGEMSEPRDYQLANGEVTNSLAVHYLMWHRDEVPHSERERVLTLEAALKSTPK